MRILTLSNLYPPHYLGGYELNCRRVTNALQRRGHQVSVLTSNHGVTQSHRPAEEPGVERSLRINGYFGHPWLGIRQLREVELHNNRVLRRTLAEQKPDLVYVWNMGGISKSLLLTLQELNVPTAFYVSDHWIARSLAGDVWMDWWNRHTMSVPALVLRVAWTMLGLRRHWSKVAPTGSVKELKFRRPAFCSRALRDLTLSKGYDVAHGEIIHCQVDIERFKGEDDPGSHVMRRLLYVGRLAEDKGVMCALRAMALLKGHFEGELRIYGKGDQDYTDKLHSFVKEHSLPVTFHSATSEEMPEIYRDHDALLFTSEWEEPFAITPLEAMASGIPVIATTTGGSAELFRDGFNSLTYAAGDANDLARCISRLAEDGALRHAITVQGQRDVRERCAEPVIVDQIEAHLRDTLEHWAMWSSDTVGAGPSRFHGKATATLYPMTVS